MSHSVLHWLDAISTTLEPFQLTLASSAVALVGLWMLIRLCRPRELRDVETVAVDRTSDVDQLPNPSQEVSEDVAQPPELPLVAQPPELPLEVDVSRLPNLSWQIVKDVKLYTGIRAQDWQSAPHSPAQTPSIPTQEQAIREITGDLAPIPQPESLHELPDFIDVIATSKWAARSVRPNEGSDAWDFPTPRTLTVTARRETAACERPDEGSYTSDFDVPTLVDPPADQAFDIPTDVYPNEFGLVLLHERRASRMAASRTRLVTHPRIIRRAASVA